MLLCTDLVFEFVVQPPNFILPPTQQKFSLSDNSLVIKGLDVSSFFLRHIVSFTPVMMAVRLSWWVAPDSRLITNFSHLFFHLFRLSFDIDLHFELTEADNCRPLPLEAGVLRGQHFEILPHTLIAIFK